MDQLSKYMLNTSKQHFSYEVFRSAYDSDPKIQNMVTDFDHKRVKLKSSEVDDVDTKKTSSKNNISAMAKRATKIGS